MFPATVNALIQRYDRKSLTISNPKLPSTMRSTRSTTLPRSIMLFRSFPHSINVIRLVLPDTTVMGPRACDRECFVYRRTSDRRSVVLPTPGGPTIPTTMGGGGRRPSSIPCPFWPVTLRSSGFRFTSGT
jgi:hypothetical protein